MSSYSMAPSPSYDSNADPSEATSSTAKALNKKASLIAQLEQMKQLQAQLRHQQQEKSQNRHGKDHRRKKKRKSPDSQVDDPKELSGESSAQLPEGNLTGESALEAQAQEAQEPQAREYEDSVAKAGSSTHGHAMRNNQKGQKGAQVAEKDRRKQKATGAAPIRERGAMGVEKNVAATASAKPNQPVRISKPHPKRNGGGDCWWRLLPVAARCDKCDADDINCEQREVKGDKPSACYHCAKQGVGCSLVPQKKRQAIDDHDAGPSKRLKTTEDVDMDEDEGETHFTLVMQASPSLRASHTQQESPLLPAAPSPIATSFTPLAAIPTPVETVSSRPSDINNYPPSTAIVAGLEKLHTGQLQIVASIQGLTDAVIRLSQTHEQVSRSMEAGANFIRELGGTAERAVTELGLIGSDAEDMAMSQKKLSEDMSSLLKEATKIDTSRKA